MQAQQKANTRCLTHQLPEDQMSSIGLVCPLCKHRLYTQPPQKRPLTCWESQPAAYSLDGRPCFVYTLIWDDFRIRSLHAHDSNTDARSLQAAEKQQPKQKALALDERWMYLLKFERWLLNKSKPDPDQPNA